MPKVIGPDGVEKEITMEEFLEAISQPEAQVVGMQKIVTDSATGEELDRVDIPADENGLFDPFAGLFGGPFQDPRTLEDKIRDAEFDEETMLELAMLFLNGDDEVEPDPQKAVYYFTKLAELDDPESQYNLALLYAKGHGVARSFEQAAYWMDRAAQNGDPDAPAMAEEFRKAIAAEQLVATGDAQAQADLASVLMRLGGSLAVAGPGKDYEEAFALAQSAAQQQNPDGFWLLALAYEHGRGVEQDAEKAVQYYRAGAELGHGPSLHSLACYYMRGDVVEENPEKAVELCLQAAQTGYPLAYYFLAKAYEYGDGVEEDLQTAIEWGEKAAEVGTPDIQYEVAKLYTYDDENGKMIDAARARYWLTKAAERGYERAYSMLNFTPMWENQ